jgi:hypothetical protein
MTMSRRAAIGAAATLVVAPPLLDGRDAAAQGAAPPAVGPASTASMSVR